MMVHFQRDREDAKGIADHNEKLDQLIDLTVHQNKHLAQIVDLLKGDVDARGEAKQAEIAEQKKAADAEAVKKRETDREAFDKQRANERAAQTRQTPPAQSSPPILKPVVEPPQYNHPEQSGSLFGAIDPALLTAQGRNETMAAQSNLEQQSQRDNTFHRDVQSKD